MYRRELGVNSNPFFQLWSNTWVLTITSAAVAKHVPLDKHAQ